MRRIAKLAVRYLKADVEPPPKPTATVDEATLRKYEGYYHDANPRNQAMAFVEWLMSGRSIVVSGDQLADEAGVSAAPMPLIPVGGTLFRLENERGATRVFAENDDGLMVLAGASTYAERQSRWRVESVRWPVLISAAVVLTPLVMLIPWLVPVRRQSRRAEPFGEGGRASGG